MSLRYTGGIISSVAPSVSLSSGKGCWTLRQQFQYQGQGVWPSGAPIGGHAYTSPGTYTFTVPSGCTQISIVAIGAGGGGAGGGLWGGYYAAAGGGGLRYGTFTVTPGNTYTVVVGSGGAGTGYITSPTRAPSGGNSSVVGTGIALYAYGGQGGEGAAYYYMPASGVGGSGSGGDAGYTGATGGGTFSGAGGGAAGYGANGGTNSGGCGGTGGNQTGDYYQGGGGGGGGVGLYGQGTSGSNGVGGAPGSSGYGGNGGSGGTNGSNGYNDGTYGVGSNGGPCGGGGGAGTDGAGSGGNGGIRIIWGAGRSFPSTNTVQNYLGFTEAIN